MIYSATPEFVRFCRKYIGRRVTEDFINVFCNKNLSDREKSFSLYAIDPLTLTERMYKDCYRHCFDDHSLCDGPSSYHYLNVQVVGGRIIRIFPPENAWCTVIVNETFHSADTWDDMMKSSPSEADIRQYSCLLDKCTIEEDVCLPDKYIDIPLISDCVSPCKTEPNRAGYDVSLIGDDEEGWQWSWECLFDNRAIAFRRGDIPKPAQPQAKQKERDRKGFASRINCRVESEDDEEEE